MRTRERRAVDNPHGVTIPAMCCSHACTVIAGREAGGAEGGRCRGPA